MNPSLGSCLFGRAVKNELCRLSILTTRSESDDADGNDIEDWIMLSQTSSSQLDIFLSSPLFTTPPSTFHFPAVRGLVPDFEFIKSDF